MKSILRRLLQFLQSQLESTCTIRVNGKVVGYIGIREYFIPVKDTLIEDENDNKVTSPIADREKQ